MVKLLRFLKSGTWAAAFLMATSAIGPGFLYNTAVFTRQIGYDFGFVILLSVLIDLVVQRAIWQIVFEKQAYAHQIADQVWVGSGKLLSVFVVLGGLAFNIGNLAGTGMGLELALGIPDWQGALLSALISIGVFRFQDKLGVFSQVLGLAMLGLVLIGLSKTHLDLVPTLRGFVLPGSFDANACLTLVGGTVGGYISFAGAHKMLESKGLSLKSALNGANQGILITAMFRIMVFLMVLYVVNATSESKNMIEKPLDGTFKYLLGHAGLVVSGLLLWAAAITSVVGATFTSITFIKTYPAFSQISAFRLAVIFICFSLFVFLLFGSQRKVLTTAGQINGLFLPFCLGIMLIAAPNLHKIIKIGGWLAVLLMALMGLKVFF